MRNLVYNLVAREQTSQPTYPQQRFVDRLSLSGITHGLLLRSRYFPLLDELIIPGLEVNASEELDLRSR